jgi:phenylalanyl-tRNA synthetase alpha chain
MTDLAELERDLLHAIAAATDPREIEELRVSALGKKGSIAELLKTLGAMAPEQRKIQGPLINGLRDRIAEALAARKKQMEEQVLEARLLTERVDVTLPAPDLPRGSLHPVSHVRNELIAIFADLDFRVAEGPDIESDEYNFTRLNIPAEHPARQMHDTFYLKPRPDGSRSLLRTHTSPVQVRTMLSQKPPIRIIAPGRTYRRDSDATHSPMFHQVEGLVIDTETHLGHLKWILEEFCKAFFEVPNMTIRLRPSYFPFTEPSVEVDIQCDRSGGQIRFGEGNDWMEIAGAGMVHPRVLELCGIDPAHYQGFAFGFGIDRLAMLKYGIPDLRPVFESDLRWLKHYGFSVLDVPALQEGLSQ